MTYSESAQIFHADVMSDGRLIIWWNESESLVFKNEQAFLDYCATLTPQIKLLLRTLLLLDYSEQRVDGKTASLSISDPDNIWVVAS
jgi:hypothetical protein